MIVLFDRGQGGSVSGYAVVDVETTGLSARSDRIVELAVVRVDEAGHVEDEWATLLNPGRDLGPQAIHRISAADVLDAPKFEDVAGAVAGLLAGRVFVAHNAAFDRRFVQAELDHVGLAVPDLEPLSVCTMHWAGRLLPVTYRTLAGCCACAGVALGDAHEALADARAAAGLLGVLVARGGPELPWKDTLVAASRAAWPQVGGGSSQSDVRTVRRGASAERGHFLARLVATAPPPPSDEEAAAYLATLDRALLDRFLSEREQRALVELASDLRIDRRTAEALHRDYLRELALRALDDGVVTTEEMADLDAVAALLGLGPQDVEEALAAAADAPGTPAASPRTPGFALTRGDLVVFTGEMLRPREEWEEAASGAGLVPWRSVTKKVRIVVAADPDSLSTKARKAADYGIPIVGEDAFAAMLAALRETFRSTRSATPAGAGTR